MTDPEYKIPFDVRLERQLESAERKFRSAEHLWTWDIIRKMIEEESKYDADVITFLKDEMRKSDERLKQWKLENEGKVWWHNSKINKNKFSIECPGEGWVLGMIFGARND